MSRALPFDRDDRNPPLGDPGERPQLRFESFVRPTGKRVEFRIDVIARTLREGEGFPVSLTEGEFLIMQELSARPRETVSRSQLDVALSGGGAPSGGRRVDVHISRLRRKFMRERLTLAIRTRAGEGYSLDPH